VTDNPNHNDFNRLTDEPINEPIEDDDTLFDEEFSEPIAPSLDDELGKDHGTNEVYFQSTSFIGWISLILSFIGLFTMPVLFGTAGIITGFIARNRDAEWLGNIAIVLGIISIISAIFIRPFM